MLLGRPRNSFVFANNYNWDKIIHAFAYANTYNTKGANLHYLGSVLSNLSQSKIVRRYV